MAHVIPEAKTALKAILVARGPWASVDIRDGGPTEEEDVTDDAFWFTDTQVPQDGWAALGNKRREITFDLGFTIALRRFGDEERDTEDLMWVLFEDLMFALKENPNLSNTIRQITDVTGRQTNFPAGPQQWAALFQGQITCESNAY